MFGEFAVYVNGKVVGFIWDNTFFVRITPSGELFAGNIRKGKPYPGAKDYFKISKTNLKETRWLRKLLELVESDLPKPQPKRKKLGRSLDK